MNATPIISQTIILLRAEAKVEFHFLCKLSAILLCLDLCSPVSCALLAMVYFYRLTLVLMNVVMLTDLSGALRMGFHDLMNAIHLDAHSKIRLLTEHEYVFPLRITSPDNSVSS